MGWATKRVKMKVVNETSAEITYMEVNTGFARLVLIFGVVTYFLGLIPLLIMIYYDEGFMRAVGCFLLMLLTFAVWLFYKFYKDSKTIIYKINRIKYTFEIVMGARRLTIDDFGGFSKLEIQGFSIPASHVSYQLVLVGSQRKFLLNLMAFTRNGLINKAKPISSFLNLDIETTDQIAGFQELIELKKKPSLEYL